MFAAWRFSILLVRTVVGWILVDQGLRFPGDKYAAISQSVSAHDPMVSAGNMTVMLLAVFLLEMIGGAAVFGAASGSGRQPGKPFLPFASFLSLSCSLFCSEARRCRSSLLCRRAPILHLHAFFFF